jgi:cell division protein FtsZ
MDNNKMEKMDNEDKKTGQMIPFQQSVDAKKIIKVIGVGGGGGNAVTHMYKEGMQNVSFALCNTDWQHMEESGVPVKLVIGRVVLEGLGSGNQPHLAKEAALESEEEIRQLLSDGTKMVFITAGMGGGTGTGAAPEVARIAKEMGILTVGIVTIPFLFEGYDKIIQALDGVTEMSKNVDALLVINNERLSEYYQENLDDAPLSVAMAKADDTLTIAAKSISDMITRAGKINVDFNDVKTTLKNGGVTLISTGYGEGEQRMEMAIKNALFSPLLSHNDIENAKRILVHFTSSSDKNLEIRINELQYVRTFMKEFSDRYIKVIYGQSYDDSLEGKIKFTLLASGFGLDEILTEEEKRDISHRIEQEERKNAKRIRKFYGDKLEDPVSHVVILTAEELDDERIITLMEEHPTYGRDPNIISKARTEKATVTSVSHAPGMKSDVLSIRFE